MRSLCFRTDQFATPDQFDAWVSWLDRVFDADRLRPPESGFQASHDLWTIGRGCTLGKVLAPRSRLIRNPTLIRRSPLDPWCISMGRTATTTVHVADRTFEAGPGVPFLVSLGKEMITERDQDARLQLYLSRDEFPGIAPVLDAASGGIVAGTMGTLLSDFLLMLERQMHDIPETELPRLAEAIAAMVAACVAPSPDRLAETGKQIDMSRLERVRRTVQSNLRSAELAPQRLCRQVGISRSQLYRLMEPHGGVAQFIRRQRLLAAYSLLSDPSVEMPITRIAEEFCFSDGSSFSRAFRQEFLVSPNAVRSAARRGEALPQRSKLEERLPGTRLFQMLHGG